MSRVETEPLEPLAPGHKLGHDVRGESRPRQPKIALDQVDRHFPDGEARGRRGSDGTNWCLCCDTVIGLGPRAAFCAAHSPERNTVLQAAGRAERATQVSLPMDAVDKVVDSTDRLLTVLGRATAEFNRSRNVPVG